MKKITFRCLKIGDYTKIVFTLPVKGYEVKLSVGNKNYDDLFNDAEPYNRYVHVFIIENSLLSAETILTISYIPNIKIGLRTKHSLPFGTPVYADYNEIAEEYNNLLKPEKQSSEELSDGLIYRETVYRDKNGAPVKAFSLELSENKYSVYVGTPDDGYKARHVKATIPQMMDAAIKNGIIPVAAVNGDFFEMWGDHHPSGLCVKNGRVIYNPTSERYFFGIKKDGTPVITNTYESEGIVSELEHAVSGLQLIVSDGKLDNFAPLESFSFTRHPRTAVGIRKNGDIVLLVVDGRIPDYSNGASLVDLAHIMISLGCDRALNLDGGGSSSMFTTNGKSGHILRSRPADKFRPNAMSIRNEFNCLLVVHK